MKRRNILLAASVVGISFSAAFADSWNTGTSGYISSNSATKVGIGTIGSSAKNKLDVEGAMAVGATYSGTSTAPANGAIIEGTVGVGTAAPTAKLHVLKTTPHSSYSESAIYGNCNTGTATGYRACGVSGEGTAGSGVTYAVGVEGMATGANTAISGFFWGASGPTSVNLCAGWGSIPVGNWAATLFGNTYIAGDLTLTGKIKIKNWTLETPDYVFAHDYKLRSLDEVEAFI